MAGGADIDMDSADCAHACDIDAELEYVCSESESENEETTTSMQDLGAVESDESVEPPRVGQVFGSMEDLERYYRRYAKQQGFGITKTSMGRKGKNRDKFCNVTWKCWCSGQPDKRRKRNGKRVAVGNDDGCPKITIIPADKPSTRKSRKVGCKAKIYACLTGVSDWQIRTVELEHSGHRPSPSLARHVHQERKEYMTPHVKKSLIQASEMGLKVPQIRDNMVRANNGEEDEMPTDRDMCNVLAKVRRLKLQDGDANAMMKYFKQMTENNQNFFHSERIDTDGTLKDVLWVDARSRAAYEEFGDVVCFDTTYLTNEYDLPLVNFVGVNHHGQSILLGCALVSHEDTETFEWVFETWLHYICGKAPPAILTDQAPAIRSALANVMPMPTTRHRWCLWHIMQKFGTKLGCYKRYDEFSNELEDVIYESLTPDEFESRWKVVFDEYDLGQSDWLRYLYYNKKMWVPAYCNDVFWAGMKMTQRVRSNNSFFDNYVLKHTRLCEFADKYCFAMEQRVKSENDADAESCLSIRQTATDFMVEKVFQGLYTDAKFLEVQGECQAVLYCNNVEKIIKSETLVEHIIDDRVKSICQKGHSSGYRGAGKKRLYRVRFNTHTNELDCDCKMFEVKGIMCRHMIRVYDMYDVAEIPKKYILRRWRKDIHRKHTMVKVAYHDPSKTVEVKRYDKMTVKFEAIASKAMYNQSAMDVVLELLLIMDLKVDNCLDGTKSVETMSSVELKRLEQDQSSQAFPSTNDDRTSPSVATYKDTPKRKNKVGVPRLVWFMDPVETAPLARQTQVRPSNHNQKKTIVNACDNVDGQSNMDQTASQHQHQQFQAQRSTNPHIASLPNQSITTNSTSLTSSFPTHFVPTLQNDPLPLHSTPDQTFVPHFLSNQPLPMSIYGQKEDQVVSMSGIHMVQPDRRIGYVTSMDFSRVVQPGTTGNSQQLPQMLSNQFTHVEVSQPTLASSTQPFTQTPPNMKDQ